MEMTKKRGRPVTLKTDHMRQAVSSVFWQKGYSGASLTDLTEATGVSRPSLYENIGDKMSMYLNSLESFQAMMITGMQSNLSGSLSLEMELLSFFKAAIRIYTPKGRPQGCMIYCTLPSEAVEKECFQNILNKYINELESIFQNRFEKARSTGEISNTPTAAIRATFATATLQSLALRARSGAAREELEKIATESLSFLTMK
jgi:TetR/AcrR family transcriptional regulator, copper-responsive repressor